MDLEYRLDGPDSAPVLVLSNSLGTLWSLWDNQFTEFSKYFRVLRYHTRGHGSSPLPAEALTLASLGQDVIALLDHLHIDRAHFCGISLGGLTGLWLNRFAPQRFDRLVIASSAAKIGQSPAWLERAAGVRQHGMAEVAATSAERWFSADFIQHRPGIVAAYQQQIAQLSPNGYAACCEALASADLRAEIVQMSRPQLMIAGERDPVTTIADAQQVVVQAPASQLVTLPASHLSNVECGPAFTTTVLHFLTGKGSDATAD